MATPVEALLGRTAQIRASARHTVREGAKQAVMSLAVKDAHHLPSGEGPYPEGRVLLGPLRGMRFVADNRQHPGYWVGMYEPHVVRAMTELVEPGDTTLDIGGHMGYMSLVLSKAASQWGKVYTFEPDPGNSAFIRENLRLNGVENVEVVDAAVTSEPGVVTLARQPTFSSVSHIASEHEAADAVLVPTRATTVDEFVAERRIHKVAFMKIDVEGHEDSVFVGARETIAAHRPIIVAEVRQGAPYEVIQQVLRGQGYRQEVLGGGNTNMRDMVFRPS